MNIHKTKVFGAVSVTLTLVAFLLGPVGTSLALADHGDGGGNGGDNNSGQGRNGSATVQMVGATQTSQTSNSSGSRGDDHGSNFEDMHFTSSTATSTVATSTITKQHDKENEDQNENQNENQNPPANNSVIAAKIQALEALVQKLIAELIALQQRIGIVDVTPPTITSATAANVATSTADVTWMTNEFATSKVYLSTSTPVNLLTAQIASNADLTVNHTIHLSGLTPNTGYFLVAESADASNNIARSAEVSFTTGATSTDVTAPMIASTTATNITTSTADIGWATNESATSKVYVSTTTPVNLATAMTLANTILITSHSLHLTGLMASTTYFVIVESADAANNIARSTQFSFVTAPTSGVVTPLISSTTVTDVTSSTAEIHWATNELTTSKIFFSTTTPVNAGTAANVFDGSLALNHSLHLTGLTASTTYFFVVQSKDAANNTTVSPEHSFVTTL
jgi:hypothetical protein